MAIETTPLGFKKPDGNELVRSGDNVIADNAQRAQELLSDTRNRLGAVEAGVAPDPSLVEDPDNPGMFFLALESGIIEDPDNPGFYIIDGAGVGVNRLISVGEDSVLPASVVVDDANLPVRLGDAALDTRYLLGYKNSTVAPANTDLIKLDDAAGFGARMISLKHYADGTAGDGQTYAIDVSNRPGAKAALVIHQYSNLTNTAALHIDNTATQPGFRIWNTENTVLNPGSVGTGAFFQLRPWQAPGYFHFTNDLVFENKTQYGLVARVPTDGQAVPAFTVDQQQAQVGLQVAQAAEAFWGATVTSAGAYGASVKASSTAGGQSLYVERGGVAGTGEAVRIVNKGTGDTIAVRNATAQVAKIASTGEYENMVPGNGIVIQSPNGTRYRIKVSDGGVISAVAA